MYTKVAYGNTTKDGKIEILINCENERDYLLAIENRKWLYPKIGNMVFGIECIIRADPTLINQVDKILNKLVNDLLKLIEISQEE